MRKELHPTRLEGTITIYLTLILLIILSLIFTIIEGARVSTAKQFAKRALSTSMDSVMAEYYRPLWEEYHVFGYYAGKGSSDTRSVGIEEKLVEYMSYTMNPRKDLEGREYQNALELYDIALEDIAADNQTKLIDYEGELFINEAVEYMKYDEMAGAVELLLDKMSLLEAPKKLSTVYDEKLAAEEELVEIDKSVLRLMELLDGIKTSNKGIELDREGRLQIKQYFVKMFCNTQVNPEVVNIHHDVVFLAVKDHYINPIDNIGQMKRMLESLKEAKQALRQLEESQKENRYALEKAQEELDELNRGNTKSKSVKKRIKETKDRIASIREAGMEISLAIREQNKILGQYADDVRISLDDLLNKAEELIPLTREAIRTIGGITGIASRAIDSISKFEKLLSMERENLDMESFQELEEELKAMKRYSSSSEEENSYIAMRESLENNLRHLQNAVENLKLGQSYLNQGNHQATEGALTDCSNELVGYEIIHLKLDYSSLVLDQSKQRNPVGEMSNLLQQGLTSLVIDPQTISKKTLSSLELPSIEEAMLDNTPDFTELLTKFMKSCSTDGGPSGINDFFHSFADTSDITAVLGKGINIITEKLLFQEYLRKHFEQYNKKSEGAVVNKPSALVYEQEYLLTGKNSDQENLASVIARIVFLRTIANFVSILRDKVKCGEALAAATALVGFTGFPVLISITKTILLIIWAFAEALVDTCALMMGKEVPIIKKSIILGFPELFLINRSYLESKASNIEAAKLSFSYQDYLSLFLLLKNKKDLAYRAMDLIQENINLRYEEKFQITNCLYGLEASAEFQINTKFLAIPFIRKTFSNHISGFGFQAKFEYSY